MKPIIPNDELESLTQDEKWYRTKYEPINHRTKEDILPKCPHGNYIGRYKYVKYSCMFCEKSSKL